MNRFLNLQASAFRSLPSKLCLSIVETGSNLELAKKNSKVYDLSLNDIKRLDAYSRNLIDYHLILDLIPGLAKIYFLSNLPIKVTSLQQLMLLVVGMKGNSLESISKEFNLPMAQVLALFNKSIKKFTKALKQEMEKTVVQAEEQEQITKSEVKVIKQNGEKNGKEIKSAKKRAYQAEKFSRRQKKHRR